MRRTRTSTRFHILERVPGAGHTAIDKSLERLDLDAILAQGTLPVPAADANLQV